MTNQIRTPVNIGEQLAKPREFAPMAKAVGKMLAKYKHKVSEFIVIDYMVDDNGFIQFHIFPRVPDHKEFYPNNQVFASEVLESSVSKILGKHVVVEAEFHEKDGIIDDGNGNLKKADTRVREYIRDSKGNFTSILFHSIVPKVWMCIKEIPGLIMPKDKVSEILVETIVEAANRAVRVKS